MPAERPVPGQTPETAFLRSLRFQAPLALSSLSYRAPVGEIVNMAPLGGPRKYPEEDAKARKRHSNQLYEKTPRAKARQKRYFQTDKGKAAIDRGYKTRLQKDN